jgi:HlyD family secretion protein
MNGNWTRNKSLKWAGVVILLVALSAIPIWYGLRQRSAQAAPAFPPEQETSSGAVSCLGRIQPEDGVIHVAGPYIWGDSHAPRVETLNVQEGDEVHRGQALAVFIGRSNLEASLALAEAQTAKARRRVEQVKAGASDPEVAAQQADIARLEADAQHARSELKRYEALRATDDVTVSEVEARRNAAQVAEFAASAARHRLESMQKAPASDINLANADLAAAEAAEQRARRDFALSTIYAPADGKILKINAREGEAVGQAGLLDIARTEHMFVLAEVYETDLGRVRVGQHATISGDVLGATVLTGVVERISPNVKDAAVMPGDTVSFSDKRVVETLIRLDRNQPAANLIGGKVIVVIQA